MGVNLLENSNYKIKIQFCNIKFEINLICNKTLVKKNRMINIICNIE